MTRIFHRVTIKKDLVKAASSRYFSKNRLVSIIFTMTCMTYFRVFQTCSTITILDDGDSSGSNSVQHEIKSNPCFFVEKLSSYTLDITRIKSFLYTLFFRWMSEESPAINFSSNWSDGSGTAVALEYCDRKSFETLLGPTFWCVLSA